MVNWSVTFDRADLRHAADVVAAEIEQHQMFGALLLVRQQIGGQRLVLGDRLAAPARAGDGADRHFAGAHAHQDFRARADDLEAAEIEIAEEGRRVHTSQRAIEREGRQGEGRGEALRQHDLENVARANVFLGLLDHVEKARLGRVGHRRLRQQMRIGAGIVHQRAFQPLHHRVDALERAVVGGARGQARSGAHGRHDRHFVAHAVEHGHHGRADHDRVGRADRIGLGRREPLHLAHHVVAEIAEHARRHRRHAFGLRHGGFGDQRAQRDQRFFRARLESVASVSARRLMSALPALARHATSGSRPIIE